MVDGFPKIVILFTLLSVGTGGAMSHEAAVETEGSNEESRFPDAEFVGSTSFRTASLVQPLWKQLNFDGHTLAERRTTSAIQEAAGRFVANTGKSRPVLASLLVTTVFELCRRSTSAGAMSGRGLLAKACSSRDCYTRLFSPKAQHPNRVYQPLELSRLQLQTVTMQAYGGDA